jgi:hypothetical protein
MASEVAELLVQIDARIADLDRVQKQLKRRSTLSFAERRDLSSKAGKAAADLSTHRARLAGPPEGPAGEPEEAAEATDGTLAEPVREARAALESAQTVLDLVAAAQPEATHLLGKRLPGEYRR